MPVSSLSSRLLEQEARALLTRLARVKPFVLYETMVPAAALTPVAQTAIERYLDAGRHELRKRVHQYLAWIGGPEGQAATPEEAQRRLTFLRLRFAAVLTQFDVFSDVITQRSEHETGVWLSGLDVAAADALQLPGAYDVVPSVVCYLARGHGAAIRRARTRLPGGGDNPVAIIRIPRERMVGSGIASSLVHEVGHQGSALLDLVNSLRPMLQGMQKSSAEGVAWLLWERWISEIVADFWSVAKVGVASTLGLVGVVSLPRAFVFRLAMDDPHPVPWIRVKLSCAMGRALYPHRQWDELARLWQAFYPIAGTDGDRRRILQALEATMDSFVTLLIHHRPRMLRGRTLMEAMPVRERQPSRLLGYWQSWQKAPDRMRSAAPSLAFAVLGQARANGLLGAQQESDMVAKLLTHWALRSTLDLAAMCAGQSGLRTASASVTASIA
jgi:hypothetical protein